MKSKYMIPKLDSWPQGMRTSWEFRMLCVLIEKWGMVQGQDDGEDTAGRAKIGLMSVQDTVDRTKAFIEAARDVAEKDGWIEPPVSFDDYKDMIAVNERMRLSYADDARVLKLIESLKERELVT